MTKPATCPECEHANDRARGGPFDVLRFCREDDCECTLIAHLTAMKYQQRIDELTAQLAEKNKRVSALFETIDEYRRANETLLQEKNDAVAASLTRPGRRDAVLAHLTKENAQLTAQIAARPRLTDEEIARAAGRVEYAIRASWYGTGWIGRDYKPCIAAAIRESINGGAK